MGGVLRRCSAQVAPCVLSEVHVHAPELPQSLGLVTPCHSLWGSLRHIPLAYASWAVGRHQKYAAAPFSFMACFLFLFLSLSFECFALTNNLMRYNHKVEALGPTIFFRVPALVVALYTGAALCLTVTPSFGRRAPPAGAADAVAIGFSTQNAGRMRTMVVFVLRVVGRSGVVLGGVLMVGASQWLSLLVDEYQKHREVQEQELEVDVGEGVDEYAEVADEIPWPMPPPQASSCMVVPALVLGVLLLYFACYFSSTAAAHSPPSSAPDRLLFSIPLVFFALLDGAVVFRALGLDSTDHEPGEGKGGLDDINNLHTELAAPAQCFVAINSVLALWTSVTGCSLLSLVAVSSDFLEERGHEHED
eukprot:CAMPEP_0114483602 /NCGR_PEP_ID=MMETSP0104-20121206/18963_1 /TAXON_ID=37642 ORGANISM="Paraphysomonas imperforata, Strain PA2" /NCGR_SAMPLE_ID=MMETSP0104 /ASSEMBLY_ACC=CAM_ASM_000202 /LENGTH=361 /DNA_ID=CAMNT_0001659585 /DNA_START=256 /DNA_END=1341 /DNA_ORIENTATION=-